MINDSGLQTEEEYLEWIADFINKQVPLDAEYEKVLRDNLWSLYECI